MLVVLFDYTTLLINLAFALQLRKSLSQRNAIFGVFIREQVWFENSLSQSEEVATGRGRVRIEKQAVEGRDTKWRTLVCMGGRNGAASEWGSWAMGRYRSNCCVNQVAVCFLWACAEWASRSTIVRELLISCLEIIDFGEPVFSKFSYFVRLVTSYIQHEHLPSVRRNVLGK